MKKINKSNGITLLALIGLALLFFVVTHFKIISISQLTTMAEKCNQHQQINLSYLYGKWQEGTTYERYYADSVEYMLQIGDVIKVVGTTWDVADDMTEKDALPFNWTLKGNDLLHSHINFNGTITPKNYTITKLSANALVYHDDYGVEHSLTKVIE